MRTAPFPQARATESGDDEWSRPSPSTSKCPVHAGAPRQDGSLRVVGVDVAGTRAVAQFHDRVVDLHRPIEFRMRHRTILVGVAAGAVRPESGEFPGDDLGVRYVAAGAADCGP